MGIGTLAHTVGKLPLKLLTARLSEYNIDFVQLAPGKAIDDIDTSPGRLSPGLANYIAEQFDRAGVRIGALGCYINPIHPDPVKRRQEINRFKEHLRFARDFGTSIVATETSALITYRDQDPERYIEIGWNVLRETVEELAEEAEKWGVIVGLEPVRHHTISSPEKTIQILKEIPSPNIGIVFDPINLLSTDEYKEQDAFVDKTFRLLGDRIVLAHLKDAVWENEVRKEVRAGCGNFNTAAFLEKLHRYKPFIDISLENVNEGNLADTVSFIRGINDPLHGIR